MMADCGVRTDHVTQEYEVTHPYVSCIRIYGRPILPPLMTAARRDEMRHYKNLAELVQVKLKSKKKCSKITLAPTNPVETDTPFKHTQEILEEFDPFAPTSCSTETSEMKCRHSGSSDEFSTSKTGSSSNSLALTNSTDLYHYMDITGSSLGDGRTTRRSETPVIGGDWNSPPDKLNLPEGEIKSTYEDLNEYLDSILISSASSPPSHHRTKLSDGEATPTNSPLCDNFSCDVQMVVVEDKRPKSCPLSPIPRERVSERLVDVVGISTECAKPDAENVPRLVRSNSYTLDAPSPMLLAHLEAERKKNETAKVVSNKVDAKQKIVPNTRNKVWGVAPKSHVMNSSPKKAKSPYAGSVPHSPSASNANKIRFPTSPKSPKSPKVGVTKTSETKKDLASVLIGQPDVRKLFADLQAEHSRQMEQLLVRQRKQQELIREAILGQKVCPQKVKAKVDVFNPSTTSVRNFKKSLSSSFIISEISSNIRDMTLSAPPGSLALTFAGCPKRPSSSPALTTPSSSAIPPAPETTDTNGNLTSVFNSEILVLSDSSNTESALPANENGFVNEMSPRTRRRAWGSRQDPDWLEFSRQSQRHWAACKIQAGVRGYLTRRLLRTERVQGCITVIHDTILCALELQKECGRNIEPSDLQLHGRLIHQLSDACREIHSIFVEIPVTKRMAIIALDRERLESRSPRTNGPHPLSRATQIALTRKMAQSSQNNSHSVGSTVSTRRKNWTNMKSPSSCTQPCEIVGGCFSRSPTSSNGDTQRAMTAVSGGGCPRKPWR